MATPRKTISAEFSSECFQMEKQACEPLVVVSCAAPALQVAAVTCERAAAQTFPWLAPHWEIGLVFLIAKLLLANRTHLMKGILMRFRVAK